MFGIQVSDSTGCIPLDISFNAITGDRIDQIDYSWKFGDGVYGAGPKVSHSYQLPDKIYDLTLVAASRTTGCRDTLFKPKFINVFPQPVAAFNLNQQLLSNDNPMAIFTNQSNGADHFLWKFGDGKISRLKDPTHLYNVVGRRRVLLESINEFGCLDTLSKEVMIALDKIFAPNAFSPNAASAVDRVFLPWCNGVLANRYHLKIVNRWNEVIYECKDELKGWDGRLSNGSQAPVGNYVWILYYEDFLGKYHNQNGAVTLVY